MSDRRRLTGPANLIKPNIPEIVSNIDNKNQENTNSTSSIPSFFIKHAIINNANGSAYLEINNTIIEVSIFGPRPIRGSFIERGSLSVECKFLNHIIQPMQDSEPSKTGMSNIEHRLSSYLESCILPCILLEKYPKSTIDIQVSIISIDKSMVNSKSNSSLLWLMNWIVICTSIALIDSKIEIKDVISSGQIKLTRNGKIKIGIEDDEVEECIDALISFMNLRNDEIVGIWLEGNQSNLTESEMSLIIDECNKMSKIIRANMNSYLINNI
ncbi:unnamed protein product [Candida verbasci]|uniref:Exoribonuclease phosphorolytic domain-containing protein n=1 Tax=Candida verbasci TaxID=1227364 RepID=A0A9W4TQW1_9ASCO|nr:unnamed protein product [Candida verbasci]